MNIMSCLSISFFCITTVYGAASSLCERVSLGVGSSIRVPWGKRLSGGLKDALSQDPWFIVAAEKETLKQLPDNMQPGAIVALDELKRQYINRQLCDRIAPKTLHGHEGWVMSVAWHPEGRLIASGSGDKTIKVWDAQAGKELYTLRGHEGAVMSVAWHPEGQQIASGSVDRTVKVWDVVAGTELQTLCGHEGDVRSVAWHPEGQLIASGSLDKTIKVWDAVAGKKLHALLWHRGPVNSVAWDPKGMYIASGSSDQTIKVWRQTYMSDVQQLSSLQCAVLFNALLTGRIDDQDIFAEIKVRLPYVVGLRIEPAGLDVVELLN